MLAERSLLVLMALVPIAPSVTFLFPALVGIAFAVAALAGESARARLAVSALGVIVFLLVALGMGAGGLLTAVAFFLVAEALPGFQRVRNQALVLLLFQASVVTSASFVAAAAIQSPLSPILVAPGLLIAIAAGSGAVSWTVAGVSFLFAMAASLASSLAGMSPALQQTLAALPVAGAFVVSKGVAPRRPAIIIAIAVVGLSWIGSLPSPGNQFGFFVPKGAPSFEAQDFLAAAAALRWAGISSETWTDSSAIPERATVLIPAFGREVMSDGEWDALVEAGRVQKATFLVAVEHTNLWGRSERVNRVTHGLRVASDTTVPPGNADLVTGLRASGMWAFPALAHLNRGSSIQLTSLWSKAIVWGDGWFSDLPPSSVAGRLGDYSLAPGEQRGRLLLAAASVGWPRLVVIGDTTPTIDRFIVADPRPLGWIIRSASLIPAFTVDLTVLLLVLFGLVSGIEKANLARGLIALAGVGVLIVGGERSWFEPSDQWRAFYRGESAFDPRNFSSQIATWLATQDQSLPYLSRHASGRDYWAVAKEAEIQVHFGLVQPQSRVLGIAVGACRRLGRVPAGRGVRLQDAQVCEVAEGENSAVLIGSREEAAAFVVKGSGGTAVVILDQAFLSNRSTDTGNLAWLRDEIADLVERNDR